MINPCRHCGNEPQENVAISCHTIICVRCWNQAQGTHYDAAVRNWNSENPLPEPNPQDRAWIQATELAQSGKADETPLAEQITTMQTTALDFLLRVHVKNTADELPDVHDEVLVWANNYWVTAWRDVNGDWENHVDYISASEVKYWLPLPTFNPEETQ